MKWYRSKWFIVIVAVSVCAGGSYAYLAKEEDNESSGRERDDGGCRKKEISALPYPERHSSSLKIHKSFQLHRTRTLSRST